MIPERVETAVWDEHGPESGSAGITTTDSFERGSAGRWSTETS
jgi:hypothetical protein